MARGRSRPGLRSRIVGYLKIALPLVALGLLSTVFLFQEDDAAPGGITFSENDRDTMRDGLAVYNPKFSGVTPNGDRFYLEAAKATPDDSADPNEVALVDLTGQTEYASGLVLTLKAARAQAYLEKQIVEVSGGMRIVTSNGFEGMATAGTVGLETGSFVSDGPVTLQGAIGYLEAGSMRLENEQDGEGVQNQVFTFENGVKLTLTPE